MPQTLKISSATNTYTYAADGRKLKTVLGGSKTTDYCGNVIYENGLLKRILVDGGYIENGTYYFYLTDHLGNNRVIASSSGSIVQSNHYYPFGMSFAEGSATSQQPYKYNGKELDTERGLNLYDYSARYMDPALGRFNTVDSLAEKYYSISPYVYVGDNPLKLIDPDGKDWKDALLHLQKSVSGNISVGLNAGASIEVSGVNVGAQVNAGSVQLGSGGLKVTSGVAANVGIIGVEVYDNAYQLDASHDVKEEGFQVKVPIWSEDYKTTTTFDSTKQNYKEVKKEETTEKKVGNINVSAALIIGVEIEVDLTEVWDFLIELSKDILR